MVVVCAHARPQLGGPSRGLRPSGPFLLGSNPPNTKSQHGRCGGDHAGSWCLVGSIQARTALTDADPARVPPTAVERERTPRPSFSLSTPQGRGNTTELVTTTGREWDPETGLYYYRARYYDPRLGRFISEDPILWAGGENFYSYVKNRPATLSDPQGLQSSAPYYITYWQSGHIRTPYDPTRPPDFYSLV